MIACPHCLAEIDDRLLFCPHCEKELFEQNNPMEIILGREKPTEPTEVVKELIMKLEHYRIRAEKETDRDQLQMMLIFGLVGIVIDAYDVKVCYHKAFVAAYIRAAKDILAKL